MHVRSFDSSAGTLAVALACALGCATTRSLGAQVTPAHDSLPVELVRALLQPYGGAPSQEFFVGKVPPALAPFLYVPKNARVVGGMSSINATTAVLDLPPGSEDVVTAYQREMPKLGWTVPTGADSRAWGFVPAAGSTMSGNGLEFCHIGQSAQMFPSPNGVGGTRLTVTVNSFGGRCAATRMAFVQQPPDMVRMPTLVNPGGSFMNPQACVAQMGVQGRSNGTTERVQSSLSANQLLDNFAKQLADSGWTSPQTVPIVRREWTHSDGANDPRELTLSASPIAGNAVPRRVDAGSHAADGGNQAVGMTNPSGAARRCLRGSSSLAGFDQSVRHHDVHGPIDFPCPNGIGPTRCSGYLQSDSHDQRPRDR